MIVLMPSAIQESSGESTLLAVAVCRGSVCADACREASVFFGGGNSKRQAGP